MSAEPEESRWWIAGEPAEGGLELLDMFDGRAEPAASGGSHCASLQNAGGAAQAYLRIARPHPFTNREVEILVEVLADCEDEIRVEYDSTDHSVDRVPDLPGAFKAVSPRRLARTGRWEGIAFSLADGRFCGAVHGADFRIVSNRPAATPLLLRAVRITARQPCRRRDEPAGAAGLEFAEVVEPETSIVVPAWNRLELSLACLRAIRDRTAGSYEVVVVDNGSTDGTAATMRSIPGLRVVSCGTNLGFAKGCNAGAAAARGRYAVFLNNDTVPQPGWLSEMLAPLRADGRIGVVGSKLLYPDTGEVQHAGMEFDADGVPYHPFRFHQAGTSGADVDRFVPAVTGACLLTERALFERLGGFDERFLNGYEDLDFCLRARDAGYLVLYRAASVLLHHEGATASRFERESANRALFLERWRDRLASAAPPRS